jgi:hypothetical protein
MAKKELSISEFREIIKEEALKLKKRMVLENEKKALMSELKSLMSESYLGEYDELEEINLNPFKAIKNADKNIHQKEQEFLDKSPDAEKVKSLYQQYLQTKDSSLLNQANRILHTYAKNVLKMEAGSAGSFVKGVYRVIKGKEGEKIHSSDGPSQGLGA